MLARTASGKKGPDALYCSSYPNERLAVTCNPRIGTVSEAISQSYEMRKIV